MGSPAAAASARLAPGTLLVDPWNSFGAARVFTPVGDAVEVARERAEAAAAGLPT